MNNDVLLSPRGYVIPRRRRWEPCSPKAITAVIAKRRGGGTGDFLCMTPVRASFSSHLPHASMTKNKRHQQPYMSLPKSITGGEMTRVIERN